MTDSLANKTALVTGASRGIGKAIAIALAEAGANVAELLGNARRKPTKPSQSSKDSAAKPSPSRPTSLNHKRSPTS